MPDKRPELATLLVRKTLADEIRWQSGPGDATVVSVLGKGRVVLQKDPGSADITIRVYDSEGEIIETFTDEDLKANTGRAWYNDLNNMLKVALRAATGADEKLSEIIDELNGDDIPF